MCDSAPTRPASPTTNTTACAAQGLGIETGVDMDKLLDAADFICGYLGRETMSITGKALQAKRLRAERERERKREL